MDAVQMPLPADVVVVSKLLASNSFGIVEPGVDEAQSRNLASVSIFGSFSAAGYSSSTRDGKIPASDSDPVSGNKKDDVESSMREILLPSSECEDSSKPLSFREANNSHSFLPKCAGKQLHQRVGKTSRSGSPCSKRSRTDQVDVSTNLVGAGDFNFLSGNSESSQGKCASIGKEKSRVLKQKFIQDGKRRDNKKFCKAASKTRYDSFFSKSGFMGCSSTTGVTNILGIYGLRSDIHDVAKHVDELSLNELLDGSYKFPTPRPQKGKKVCSSNENILCSVRKACSILSRFNVVESQNVVDLDGSGNRGMHACILGSSRNDQSSSKDICVEGLASSSKDSLSQSTASTCPSDSTLCQPNDLLERLTLPPFKDFDALLQSTPVPAVSLQTIDLHLGTPTYNRSILPPFPWSLSLGGTYRPNIDSGKLIINRTTCQSRSRWVRIGTGISLCESVTSCLARLDLMIADRMGVPCEEKKVDDIPENDDVPSTTIRMPDYGQVGPSHAVISPPASSCASDRTILKESGIMSLSLSSELNLPEMALDSSDSHLKVPTCHGKHGAEGNLRYQGNEAIIVQPHSSLVPEQQHIYADIEPSKRIHGRVDCGCYSPSQIAECRHSQHLWHLPQQVNSQAVSSPRLVAAAKILCELASDSKVMWKKEQISGKLKWPKRASHKTMKTLKLKPPEMGKAEGVRPTPKSTTKPNQLGRSTGQISPGRKSSSIEKRIQTDIKNTHQGSMNWLVPTVCRFTSNSERDLVATSKQWNVDTMRLLGPMVTSARTEKVSVSQQKPWKAPATIPQGKHWGRGRSKKE